MRVLFYTAAAIAATIAQVGQAVKIDEFASDMHYDSFSQIDAIATPIVTNTAAAPIVVPSMQGPTVAQKNSDHVTLSTDDGFNNIKATGDSSAVTKVFQKLEDSFGNKSLGVTNKALPVTTPAGVKAAVQPSQTAVAIQAINDAKIKTKEDEQEKKLKNDKEKLESDKKKLEVEAEEKVKKAKDEAQRVEKEEKKKVEEAKQEAEQK